jgi:anti-anti-sigma regulatory factor
MARLLSSTKRDDEGIIQLGGDLSGDPSTLSLAEWVEEHFVDDGVVRIRIDLSQVATIDLEGVVALGLLAAEAIKQGKVLMVVGAGGQVQGKLEETGLSAYLQGRISA